MLKQDLMYLQSTVFHVMAVIQSRRNALVITTAPCIWMERKNRANLGKGNKKNPIIWPRMRNHVKRNTLANSVYRQLPPQRPITKNIRLLETILHEKAFTLFGALTIEKNTRERSRQLKQIKEVRYKMKDFVKAMKSC